MTVDIEWLELLAEDASKGEWQMIVGPPAAIMQSPGSTSSAPGGTVFTTDPENPREREVVATYTLTTANARYIQAVQPRVVKELCAVVREAVAALEKMENLADRHEYGGDSLVRSAGNKARSVLKKLRG